ncbi:MAG: hypothetical protein RBR93_08695 [Aliarcobacter butzleri]|nr:hypothetical protein [Aliarcobacter butzleri]
MRIDLSNIDAENQERIYIKKEGEYILKVVKVTQGKTSNNNDQIKVHFQDRRGQYAMDEFVLTDNSLWKLKVFTKALKLPNIIDTNMFIDRYVKATIKAKATQNGGTIYEIKKYEPSNLTNTYIAQEPKVTYENQQVQNNQQSNYKPDDYEVDDDNCPF